MARTIGYWLILAAVGGLMSFAVPSAGGSQTPCEISPTCHPDLMRPCGSEACGCFACESSRETCCL